MPIVNRKDREVYERKMAAHYAKERKRAKYLRKCRREYGDVDARMAEYMSRRTVVAIVEESP